jgi:hypothetical protein
MNKNQKQKISKKISSVFDRSLVVSALAQVSTVGSQGTEPLVLSCLVQSFVTVHSSQEYLEVNYLSQVRFNY